MLLQHRGKVGVSSCGQLSQGNTSGGCSSHALVGPAGQRLGDGKGAAGWTLRPGAAVPQRNRRRGQPVPRSWCSRPCCQHRPSPNTFQAARPGRRGGAAAELVIQARSSDPLAAAGAFLLISSLPASTERPPAPCITPLPPVPPARDKPSPLPWKGEAPGSTLRAQGWKRSCNGGTKAERGLPAAVLRLQVWGFHLPPASPAPMSLQGREAAKAKLQSGLGGIPPAARGAGPGLALSPCQPEKANSDPGE